LQPDYPQLDKYKTGSARLRVPVNPDIAAKRMRSWVKSIDNYIDKFKNSARKLCRAVFEQKFSKPRENSSPG
jgi:hypothetical protein